MTAPIVPPTRKTGGLWLASILEDFERRVVDGDDDIGTMATQFIAIADSLQTPEERHGFMYAVGWWIALVHKHGVTSAEGIMDILERVR